MDILKASRVRRGSISFFADASNEDRQRRKELVEEIKRRAAAGEKNLVIRDDAIMSKNMIPRREGVLPPSLDGSLDLPISLVNSVNSASSRARKDFYKFNLCVQGFGFELCLSIKCCI